MATSPKGFGVGEARVQWLQLRQKSLESALSAMQQLLTDLGNFINSAYGKLLNLGLLGGGTGLTVHFWQNQQVVGAIASGFTTFLLALLTIGKKFVKQVLARIEKRAIDDAEPLADALYDFGKDLLLHSWRQLTSRFQRRYYQSLIYTCRDFRTQGLKIKSEFTLSLEKIFVPLRVAPESMERVSPAMIRATDRTDGLSIWDFLVASRDHHAYRTIAIIGAPGSGKTTLLEYVTLSYAQNTQRRHHAKAPRLIPILLNLRDIREAVTSQPEIPLGKLAEQSNQKSDQQYNPPPGWFEQQLHRRECLVMLDGLDEVANEDQRRAVSQWVSQQMQRYPKARFLVTSRPFGYRSALIEDIRTTLEVQPFNLRQMQRFVRGWYLQREVMSRLGKEDRGVRDKAAIQASELIQRIKENPPLAAMALNPLLLTMIATVHCYRGALPGRRVELYGEICDVLLGRRQDAKGIPDTLTADRKQAVLQVLALGLMERGTREFGLALGGELIQTKLVRVAGKQVNPAQFLKTIESLSGLLVEREQGVYAFAHKSFQEYLAAMQVKELQQEDLLIAHLEEDWWHETIRLYAAKSDASHLISTILERPTVVSLKLAWDFKEEDAEIAPEVLQELTVLLEEGLESSDPEIFEQAAEVSLIRRLRGLVRLDEQMFMDSGYVTWAEYQLFVNEQDNPYYHQTDATPKRFAPGQAKQPATGISFHNANGFCAWLTFSFRAQVYASEEGNREPDRMDYYRLPTPTEIAEHPARASRPASWTVEEANGTGKGIRLVKTQLPDRYGLLLHYLASGQWQKADQETTDRMLEVMGVKEWHDIEPKDLLSFPCEDLRAIDHLWVQYSNGRFGFSVQKQIWLQVGGRLYRETTNRPNHSRMGEMLFSPIAGIARRVGWRVHQPYNHDAFSRFAERVGWWIKTEYNLYYNLEGKIPRQDLGQRIPRGYLPRFIYEEEDEEDFDFISDLLAKVGNVKRLRKDPVSMFSSLMQRYVNCNI